MDGLHCRIGPTLAQGELRIKMSQSSELEDFWSEFKPASPVLNLAKKECTAWKPVDCFETNGLLCRIGPTPAEGELRVKVSQSSVLEDVWSQF
jgi:hypothetical protein